MADDLKARLGQNFFVEIDGKRYVDDTPQIARDRITTLEDHARALAEALSRAERALRPFADRVFNDNGDCTVTDTHLLSHGDFWNAESAKNVTRAALAEHQKIMGGRG